MSNIIGIDIGGTSIEGGRIECGHIISYAKADTQADIGGETTIGVLKGVISQLIDGQTTAIGIGVPSVVNRRTGVVYNVQNIAGWDEVPLKDILEAEFSLPVFVDNDANCFAYGEKIFGKGRDIENFVGVTLGTGLGAGIIHNHRLLSDANCGSGEFGEIPYMNVKLEDYCGSRFFTGRTGRSGYEIATDARKGDSEAIGVFEEYGRHMAFLVKIVMLTLDPEAIIFGGAISKSFDLFEEAIMANLSDFPYPKSVERIKIMRSEQDNSGILGAGALCLTDDRQALSIS